MANEFESFANPEMNLGYQNQTDAFSYLGGFTTAAAVDFGASLWNTFAPERYEASTEDILARTSANALAVYDENPEAVQTASFVGGLLLPGGAALKAMGMARAGIKGANWFTEAGRVQQSARMEELFRKGAGATSEYKNLRRTAIARSLANNAADAVAMEVAVLGTMGAHPFLEDYWKDPAKNFLQSVALGGVIGGGLGHVADRFALRAMEGRVASEAKDTVLKDYKVVPSAMPAVNKLQVRQTNIDNLQALSERQDLDELTKQYAKDFLQTEQVQQLTEFEALGKSLFADFKPNEQSELLTKLATDTRFMGVDAIRYANNKEGFIKPYQAIKAIFKQEPGTNNTQGSLADYFNAKGKTKSVAYSPSFDKLGDPKDIAQAARAVDLGEDAKSIMQGKRTTANAIQTPQVDAGIAIWNKTAAEVDRAYLEKLAHIDTLKPEQLAKAAVAPDDLPTLNAILARTSREPEVFKDFRLLITKEEPNYEGVARVTFAEGGVKADHHIKMAEFTNPQAIKQFDMLGTKSSLVGEALDLLKGWRTGSRVAEMRTAADAFFRGGYGGKSALKDAVGAMYNSPQSVALRQRFKELADSEGNIYLWRGMKRDPRGHAALESYTTDIQKAKEFGTPRLFKVHVDDILGAIADIGSKDGIMRNEIIVGAPARQMQASLPVSGVMKAATVANTTNQRITLPELHRTLVELKEDTLNAMIKQGFPAEVMAVRTNTPVETVKAYMASLGTKSLDELELPYLEYSSAAELGKYLSRDNKTLIMRTNLNKIPYAEMRASLDNQTLAKADELIKQSVLGTSDSTIARTVGAEFLSDDMINVQSIMRAQIGKATPELGGNKFLQSYDFYVRNMEELGKISSFIGKRTQHLANTMIGDILKPITEQMSKVVARAEAHVEFETALALNAELKGYRLYKDGQFWQRVSRTADDGTKVIELEPVTWKGQEFRIVTDETDELLKALDSAGQEMYKLKSTQAKLVGSRAISDLGFWVPATNPAGKWITYVHDKAEASTKLLWGNTQEEMLEAVALHKAANVGKIQNGNLMYFDKGQQELVNKLVGRDDPYAMAIANVEKRHGGSSAPAIVRANRDNLENIAQSYEHYITASVRNLVDTALSDITEPLKRMAKLEDLHQKNQPLSLVQRFVSNKPNAARIIHNSMLGIQSMQEYGGWQTANTTFDTVLGYAADKAQAVFRTVKNALPQRTAKAVEEGDTAAIQQLNFEELSKRLEAEGIVNPWAHFDSEIAKQMFGLAKLQEAREIGPRLVYTSNALAATAALRIGEIAQPLVNAMSLPILLTSGIADKLPATFMGVAKGTAKVPPVQVMMEGMRAAFGNVPMHRAWDKAWEAAGYYKPLVSEATDTLRLAREFEPGAVAATERALASKTVEWLSWTADKSETLVRKIAMFTGGNLAKRLYPELSDTGVTIFARDFMDRVIGNYHASQRPTMFAGTLGVAMGLFQTYMVTMAQNMYRHLELKNYKALTKMMLAQQTMFGAGSLPGFNQVSEYIGEHFSDTNVDLITGTFRALPDPVANVVLYGLPSSLGPAFYTRGELAPRVPTGVGEFPAVSMAGQAFEAMMGVADAVTKVDGDAGRALGQALSMQSISRPVARLSELATGYSVTRQGNTIAVPEEVWTATGVISRLLSTRPLEEAKLRDAIHLNTVYGSIDREERQKVTAELKTAIRNNSLTSEKVEALAEEYLRTGTPQGWRSAVAQALAQTNTSGKNVFVDKLRPNNPFNHMIEMMDE